MIKTITPPGFHGIRAITESPELDAALVTRLANIMIDEDLVTASVQFDDIADEYRLMKHQRVKLIDRAKCAKVRILQGNLSVH
jgi:hypothetical protein